MTATLEAEKKPQTPRELSKFTDAWPETAKERASCAKVENGLFVDVKPA